MNAILTFQAMSLPVDWQVRKEEVLDELLRLWEQARNDGTDLSAGELCPHAPGELLAELAEQIELLKQFDTDFKPGQSSAADDAAAFHVDGYDGIDEIAVGGQGKVILARDTRLGRNVAIKLTRDSLAEARRRFEQEAKLTGELEHPGVIPVYGFGQDGAGRPYYAMRYVPRKRTLLTAINALHKTTESAERNVAFRKLLQQCVTVCETIEYAHSKRVVHRDLKPNNILLGDHDEVFVVDFGIAKASDETADDDSGSSSDDTGQASSSTFGPLGTPAYMSPEQTEQAADAGRLSDVYSLGATLYHVLTGRPPCLGNSSAEVMAKVRSSDFPRPRQIDPSISPALEAICRKAMNLQPESRYASAHELAVDIERWLADEPIAAWPDPFAVRARRWMKRHRTLVTGLAAAFVVAIVGLSVTAGLIASKNHELSLVNSQLQQENYLRGFALASHEWRGGDVPRAENLLERLPPENGSVEYALLKQLCAGEQSVATEFDRAPYRIQSRGDFAAVAADDRIAIIDARTGAIRQTVYDTDKIWETSSFALSPNARQLVMASAEDGQFRLWDLASKKVVRKFQPEGDPRLAAFVENGNRIVTVSTRRFTQVIVQTWNVSSGECDQTVSLPTGERALSPKFAALEGAELRTLPFEMQLSPDGRRLALWPRNESTLKRVRVFDAATGEPVFETADPEKTVRTILFAPDSRTMATLSAGGSVELRSLGDGQATRSLEAGGLEIAALAFHPDGVRIATGAKDGRIRIWDVVTGQEIRRLRGHRNSVSAVSFLGDDRLVSTASYRDVKLWRLSAGPRVIRGNLKTVGSLRFAAGGKQLLWTPSAGDVGVARLDDRVKVKRLTGGDRQVTVSAEGDRMATCDRDKTYLWTGPDWKKTGTIEGATAPIAFSRDGKLLAALSTKETTRESRPAEKSRKTSFPLLEGQKQRNIELIPELHEPEIEQPTIKILDSQSGKLLYELDDHERTVKRIAFSPTADLLAAWDKTDTVTIWDLSKKRVVHRLKIEGKIRGSLFFGRAMAFSADGRWLATAGNDQKIRLWDVETGKLQRRIDGHTDYVIDVCFTPDNRRLVSASLDGTVRFWDVETGVQLMALPTEWNPTALTISPDGLRLAIGCRNEKSETGEILIWDVRANSSADNSERSVR